MKTIQRILFVILLLLVFHCQNKTDDSKKNQNLMLLLLAYQQATAKAVDTTPSCKYIFGGSNPTEIAIPLTTATTTDQTTSILKYDPSGGFLKATYGFASIRVTIKTSGKLILTSSLPLSTSLFSNSDPCVVDSSSYSQTLNATVSKTNEISGQTMTFSQAGTYIVILGFTLQEPNQIKARYTD